jgi:hypothetical protein
VQNIADAERLAVFFFLMQRLGCLICQPKKRDMRILIILLLVVLVTAFTCRKNDQTEDQYATFYYKQTQCADPWQTGSTDNATLSNVSKYLTAQGLYVASMQIKTDDVGAVCLACQCKTGKTIYISSYDTDSVKTKFLALGFQQ